jgi:hypothetical protein
MSGTDASPRYRPRIGRRGWAVAASSGVVVVVIVVIAALVVGRSGHRNTLARSDQSGSVAESDTPGSAGASSAPDSAPDSPGDAAAWADFPVHATPRPVVLLGQVVENPATGFPDDDSKIAYVDGRVQLATTLPDAPATMVAAARPSRSERSARDRPGRSSPATPRPARAIPGSPRHSR